MAHRALTLLSEQLQLDRCYVGVYHLAEDRVTFPYQVGNHRVPPLPAGGRLPDFPETLRVANDRTLVIDDLTQAAGLSDADRQNLGALGLRAFVVATLRSGGGRPLWSIVAVSATGRHWMPGEVALLEAATERTWAVLEQVRADEAPRQSEEKYRRLFESIDEGFCLIELLYDERDKAVDYYFLDVNPVFERQTGLVGAAGKRVLEIAPQTEPYWLQAYETVAQTGKPIRFENYTEHNGTWYTVYASRVGGDGSRQVAILLNDITERKRAEEAKALRLRLTQQQELFAAVQAAQEEERRRIAESLHNGMGQVLYAAKLQLDSLPPDPGQPARQEAAYLLGDAIRQVRAISHELSPAVLEEFGLRKALEVICRQLTSRRLRWHCYILIEEALPLPLPLQMAVYRLAQGLVHNVAQHAQASEATLEVDVLPEWVVLRVEDNGRGFDPATVTEGLGLKTLRGRAALLGGIVQLDTAPGEGTLIQIRFPLAFPPPL